MTTRAATDAFADRLYGRPEDFDVAERLAEVASERDVPPAQVALAWLLHKPGVTAPIVGATKLAHLEDALAAAELVLSADEIARLQEPYRSHPVLRHGYSDDQIRLRVPGDRGYARSRLLETLTAPIRPLTEEILARLWRDPFIYPKKSLQRLRQ